jgi:hypothetical protein
MKWGENTEGVNELTTKALLKVLGPNGLYVLILLTAFVLLSGASDKFK